jgi:hypothetical protein
MTDDSPDLAAKGASLSGRVSHRRRAPRFRVPEEIRPLLGPTGVLPGEDPAHFEKLLAAVGAAVKPLDVVDWLYVMDVVRLTIEIQRFHSHRQRRMNTAYYVAMESLLSKLLPVPSKKTSGSANEKEAPGSASDKKAASSADEVKESERLAAGWCNGDKEATERVLQLSKLAGNSIADVASVAFSEQAAVLEHIDNQIERLERRRNSLFQKLELRRVGWVKLMKIAINEIRQGQ